MQTTPPPPSIDAINDYVAKLCAAMERDLKEAEKHGKKPLAESGFRTSWHIENGRKIELIRRASKHLPEAVAFFMGCCSWETAVNQLAPCDGWERFCELKLKVEAYIKDIWK